MRTLRLSTVGMVVLVLLGGLGGEALARTDGSTRVTGSVVSSMPGAFPEFSENGSIGEDWVGHGRGMGSRIRYEWSDPRLPDGAEELVNFEAHGDEADGDVGAVAVSSTMLEGPDGDWSGPWIGWCDAQDRCHGTATLTGYGAHEGFYAVLTERPEEDAAGTVTQVLEGAILTGEMPPVPEPLEPAAE